MGGVFLNLMYEEPYKSKATNKWCMRQIHSVENTLRLKPFPPSATAQVEPVQTSFVLPPYVFVHE